MHVITASTLIIAAGAGLFFTTEAVLEERTKTSNVPVTENSPTTDYGAETKTTTSHNREKNHELDTRSDTTIQLNAAQKTTADLHTDGYIKADLSSF